MKPLDWILLFASATLFALGLLLVFGGDSDAAPFERSCDGKPATYHVDRAEALIESGYSLNRWEKKAPIKDSEKRAFQAHKHCVRDAPLRESIEKFRNKISNKFDRYRNLRKVTPYNCGGKWDWWAIPCYIIICETRANPFSWTIESSDGGLGPYQHTPWASNVPVPWPVNSWKDKMAHHIAADYIRRTGGIGRWSCA